MKTKAVLVALLWFFCAVAGNALACESCPKDGKQSGLEDKFFIKAKMMLALEQELGLSAEQVKQINNLKRNMKKEMLKTDADIEIAALDIEEKLSQDTQENEAIKTAVEKKYDLKKNKTLSLIEKYGALKGILTTEQKDKMKEHCKKPGQEGKRCPDINKGKKCSIKDKK